MHSCSIYWKDIRVNAFRALDGLFPLRKGEQRAESAVTGICSPRNMGIVASKYIRSCCSPRTMPKVVRASVTCKIPGAFIDVLSFGVLNPVYRRVPALQAAYLQGRQAVVLVLLQNGKNSPYVSPPDVLQFFGNSSC